MELEDFVSVTNSFFLRRSSGDDIFVSLVRFYLYAEGSWFVNGTNMAAMNGGGNGREGESV